MTAAERRARRIVAERSNGVCELCDQARAGEWHHRLPRGRGGRWEPSNGLHLCTGCHRWVTEHPAESYDEGWLLRRGESPEHMPVRTWRGYLLLDDAGDYTLLGWEKPLVEHHEGCPIWGGGWCAGGCVW